MATDKNKIVQNYCLEQLKSINIDDSEIWVAKHKILKKNFTLKRVKYRGSNQQSKRVQGNIQDKEQWCYQNIIRQTELLKKVNVEGCPRCHKMIKTSNNVYLVYDQFPGCPLNTFLSRNCFSRNQKLQLILEIAKLTNFFHLRGIVFLNLSVNNIYVYNKNSVFFSDWSLARNADNQQRINTTFIKKGSYCIAQELIEDGKYYRLSDIFSLGIIFKQIINFGTVQSKESFQKDPKLLDLVDSMIKEKVSERPALREIIRVIEICLANKVKSENSPDIKINYFDSIKSAENALMKSRKDLGINPDQNQTVSSKNLLGGSLKSEQARLGLTKNPSSRSITMQSIRSFKTEQSIQESEFESLKDEQQRLSCTRLTRQSSKIKMTVTEFVKQINKKRNLAFFLMDLSEFVAKLWICPQLGYLLLKCAYLTLTQSFHQCQTFDLQSAELKQFQSFIRQQHVLLLKNLGLLKQILILSNIKSSSFFKYELQQQKTVSERQLKTRVIEFSKEMVMFCQKQASAKTQHSHLIEYLFKTLMILKIIEQGSYQKFWEKIYLTNCAYLSSQTYFQKQKGVGIRSLRSQIAEILRK